jgi:hypothetical protein
MKPKEKAKELVSRFIESDNMVFNIEGAKECALIAVDEMIEESIGYLSIKRNKYWKKVKQEIEKL